MNIPHFAQSKFFKTSSTVILSLFKFGTDFKEHGGVMKIGTLGKENF